MIVLQVFNFGRYYRNMAQHRDTVQGTFIRFLTSLAQLSAKSRRSKIIMYSVWTLKYTNKSRLRSQCESLGLVHTSCNNRGCIALQKKSNIRLILWFVSRSFTYIRRRKSSMLYLIIFLHYAFWQRTVVILRPFYKDVVLHKTISKCLWHVIINLPAI